MTVRVTVESLINTETLDPMFGLKVSTGDGRPKRVVSGGKWLVFSDRDVAKAEAKVMQERLRQAVK